MSETYCDIIRCDISISIISSTKLCQGYGSNGNDISISLENASYVQLNNTASKLNVLVNYDVENKTLQDERINGVMKVYASNGTLVKYSSFPDGFLANETGVVEFKTTLKDPNLTDIAVNVTMFDIGKKNILSNTITSESSLQKPVSESNPFQPESK